MKKGKCKRRNRRKRIRNLLILIFLLFCGLVVGANLLVSIALVPDFMEKTAVFETATESAVQKQVHTSSIEEHAETASREGSGWAFFSLVSNPEIFSQDGYRLCPALYRPGNAQTDSHRYVLLLHGYTGCKEEMNPIAEQFALRGFYVLTPDLRCQGESEGDFIGMGWTDRKDGILWIKWILEQDPEAEIVIMGQSMGGAAALLMAEEDLPAQVKAVIADCAFSDAYEMFKKQMWDWACLPSWPLLPLANFCLILRGGYNLKNAAPIRNIDRITVPVLFIHGTEDALIPDTMSIDMYEKAVCEKQLLLIDGAGHAQSQDQDPDTYYGTIFSFLESFFS